MGRTTFELEVGTVWQVLVWLLVVHGGWSMVPASLAQELHTPRPIAGIDSVFMEELTWMEVRDAIQAGKTTVIVGTGGLEQNGPYVAIGKHNYVLQATTEAIARKLGNALVAPIIKFVPEGTIDPPSGHMQYPGTISLRQETFKLLLLDVCSSLKQHGFKDIILLGDSGENQRGMREVAMSLNKKWHGTPTVVHFIPEYYEQDRWSFDFLKTLGVHQVPDVRSAARAGMHDDYHYEAIIATVDPRAIRTEQRLAAGQYTINGVDMRPPSKTLANGRKLVEYRAQLTVQAIRKAMGGRRASAVVEPDKAPAPGGRARRPVATPKRAP
ncbi:MAG TPA: creatininase family protein [Candidatus Tectomicrobia bacterium]|jgi:creatinine amidohydrolase/Fe(II)-dependent formamide hydrolase-like protein